MKQELEEQKRILIEDQDYEKAAYIRDRVIELRKKLTVYSEFLEKNRVAKSKLVTAADVESIISEITGIPLHEMSVSETERMIKMEDELHNTIIGQNDAVKIISDAIRRSRAGISSPKHPVGSFIFLGPT